ncbi:MAG TPA: pilus assembly protein PilM [Dehalococcoidia bacterium]|nr:pilus assembly protein PilM [Dehalococcoidia bacterium]
MAKDVVTLYIDDASIRLLVSDGTRIKKWDDVPLEAGMVNQLVVQKPDEVAAKIKELFKAQKINSKKVNLGVSGTRCLSRPISVPQLPKDMLEEAVRREAKRVLPVSPEQVYLTWKSSSTSEGKLQVFMVATPRNIADSLFKTLQLAGLKPELMDAKPMLLARLVKETMAIIVDVQPTEFDIIIKNDGIPQPVRTISFPDKKIPWQNKLSMVQNEISRTIDFYNNENKQTPLVPMIPVFVSGELAGEESQSQDLSQALERPVVPLTSPLDSPDGLNLNRYMANVGLVLKNTRRANGSSLSISNLNILPTVYQPEPISLTRIAIVPSAIIAGTILLLLMLLIRTASIDISETRSQLTPTIQLLQQKLSERHQSIETIAGFEQNMNNIEILRGNIAAALTHLEMQSEQMNGDLAVTINTLPDTVNLIKISHANSVLTLTGTATSEEEVLSYLSELDASERFSSIKITSMSRISGQSVEFNAVLNAGG